MNTEKQIEEQYGKIIKKFKILHHKWEEDGYGYVVASVENVETKVFSGPLIRPKLILTNHGKPYVADITELSSKVVEYQQIIDETNDTIQMFSK